MRKALAIILLISASLSGCKSAETSYQNSTAQPQAKTAATNETIQEMYWKLVELNGRKISIPETQGKEPHFILKTENKKITGNSGCNSFNGGYELGPGSKLSFTPMASTRMFCADVEYESEFLQVFHSADNYTLNGDTLSLNKARMATLARFVDVKLK